MATVGHQDSSQVLQDFDPYWIGWNAQTLPRVLSLIGHGARIVTAPARSDQAEPARGVQNCNRERFRPGVRHPPTLEEVAARAGVSRATASRVLRGASNVSEQARSSVLDAAAQISYAPNRAARSLVTGRSDSVAFLVAETEDRLFSDPFFLGMLRGAQAVIADAGLQLVFTVACHRGRARAVPALRRAAATWTGCWCCRCTAATGCRSSWSSAACRPCSAAGR